MKKSKRKALGSDPLVMAGLVNDDAKTETGRASKAAHGAGRTKAKKTGAANAGRGQARPTGALARWRSGSITTSFKNSARRPFGCKRRFRRSSRKRYANTFGNCTRRTAGRSPGHERRRKHGRDGDTRGVLRRAFVGDRRGPVAGASKAATRATSRTRTRGEDSPSGGAHSSVRRSLRRKPGARFTG